MVYGCRQSGKVLQKIHDLKEFGNFFETYNPSDFRFPAGLCGKCEKILRKNPSDIPKPNLKIFDNYIKQFSELKKLGLSITDESKMCKCNFCIRKTNYHQGNKYVKIEVEPEKSDLSTAENKENTENCSNIA